MEGAAAWMIEKIANYPELFQQGTRLELAQQASLSESILRKLDTDYGAGFQNSAGPANGDSTETAATPRKESSRDPQ
jgi:hypothetical protein